MVVEKVKSWRLLLRGVAAARAANAERVMIPLDFMVNEWLQCEGKSTVWCCKNEAGQNSSKAIQRPIPVLVLVLYFPDLSLLASYHHNDYLCRI